MSLVIEIGEIAAQLVSKPFAITAKDSWVKFFFAKPFVGSRTPRLLGANSDYASDFEKST